MSKRPLFPSVGGTPSEQRVLDGLKQFVESVFSSQFLQRLVPESRLRPSGPSGMTAVAALKWGALNRLDISSNAIVPLPAIRPDTVGVPLYVVKPSGDGEALLTPSGKGLSGGIASIDGQAQRRVGIPGLSTYVNDGNDWYTLGGDARQLFDVTVFGAIPGWSAVVAGINTVAFQAAVDAANLVWSSTGVAQTVRVPGYRFGILLDSASWWTMPLSGSTTEFHGAVALRSGVTIEFDPGAEIVPIAPTGANSAWYYGIFASDDLYTTVGALERVKFLRPRFEFSSTYWSQSLPTVFGIMAVGVYDIAIENAESVNSSGGAAGRLARLMNCEQWRVPNLRSKDVRQVLYMSYLRSGSFSGDVDGFTEAFDIDQSCWDIRGDVSCRNGSGEGQCLDISSVQDGYFKLTCDTVGNAAIIYPKPECWESFADWVTNFPRGASGWSPDPVMVKRVTLDVEGTNVTHPTEIRSIQVGLDRTDSSFSGYWGPKPPMVQGLTLRAKFENSAPVLVHECADLDADISIDGALTATGTRSNDAAVILRQTRVGFTGITNSELSGRAVIRVKDSNGGGVRVSCPTDFSLDATVDGFNLNGFSGQEYGVRIEDLDRKEGTLDLGPIRSGGGSTGIMPTDLFLGWVTGASGYVRVHDRGGHRLTSGGTQPARFPAVSAGYMLGGRDVQLPTLSTLTGAVYETLATVSEGAKATTASIFNRSAITGNASGYCVFSVQRLRGGLASTVGSTIAYDSSAIPAGSVVVIPLDGDDDDGTGVAGDIFRLNVTPGGAGSIVSDLTVKFNMTEYSY